MVEIYKKIIEYVDEHINKDITISDLLRRMGYSRRHIYKIFQDHNSMPIMEYIRRKKMYAASGELLSGKNMYDIALDYGYETPAGFYKAFKSVFGCSPSDYKNNMVRGIVMNNQNIKSVEELTKAIELDINNAELYIQRGRSYLQSFQSSQPEKAIEDYNKALELNAKNKAEAYRGLGHAYQCLWQFDKIIENYTKVIELDPTAADYLMRGQAYKNSRDYDKAVGDYTKATELDPKTAWAYIHLGMCYFKLGRIDRTMADFDKAIEVSTDLAQTYSMLGLAYNQDLKQNDKAMECYDKSIELNPRFEWVYSNRANIYREMKQYDKAIEDYARAIELNPKAEWIYNNRCRIYEELKQYEKAIEDLDKIIELNPKAEWAYMQRGVFYENLGHQNRAAEDFDKLAELNPNPVYSYSDLGLRLYKAEQNEKAIEYFTKTIELDPGDNLKNPRDVAAYLRAYLNRGCLYDDLGREDEAEADFNKAVNIGVESGRLTESWSYWRRALHYAKREQYAKAVEDCSTALGISRDTHWEKGKGDFDAYITRAFSLGEGRFQYWYEWALRDCDRALSLEVDSGEHYERKDAYKVRGTIYKYQKQYDKAKEDYIRALELDPNDEEIRELLDTLAD